MSLGQKSNLKYKKANKKTVLTLKILFLSNLSILKIYNKEFLKSKSFYPRLFYEALLSYSCFNQLCLS